MSADRRLVLELIPHFERLAARFAPGQTFPKTPFMQGGQSVPHQHLRVALESDPVMSALLPGVCGHFSLGGQDGPIFRVMHSGVVFLAPALLQDKSALVVAARWGAEALHALKRGKVDGPRLRALLRHGRALVSQMPEESLQQLFDLIPDRVGAHLLASPQETDFPAVLCEWMASTLEGVVYAGKGEKGPLHELELPLEQLLLAGGDNRLVVDPVSQYNNYGVCPRPRPEAVHFSSSTASAISGHGFLFSDFLRRLLLDEALTGGQAGLHQRTAHHLGLEIRELLGLSEEEVDTIIIASGTDSELVSTLISLAGAGERTLCNVLVSPEESGRGTQLAASGCYFDQVTATGIKVPKGESTFGKGRIHVREVAIRDEACRVLPLTEVDAAWLQVGRAALGEGHHVIMHVMLGSKTGLTAPSFTAVDELMAEAPGRVDIVVDACQMRSSWDELAALVKRGWMVQISGSKFLTGPPFSGALLVPPGLRSRAAKVGSYLAAGAFAGHVEDWCPSWAKDLPAQGLGQPSYGPILRWLPALLESWLYVRLADSVKRQAFERFREVITTRFARSPWIRVIHDKISQEETDLARLSIIAFQVIGQTADGGRAVIEEAGCQRLFRLLNRDVSDMLPNLGLKERAAASLQCHIGQPVMLHGKTDRLAFLRLVLGARFFNMIGYADEGAFEAALEAEIADAGRVLDKIELLASHWSRFDPARSAQAQ